MSKVCTECKQTKIHCEFGNQKGGKFGLDSKCKECKKIKYKQHRIKNIDKRKEYDKNSYQNNKEKRKLYNQNWRINNPLYHNLYNKEHQIKNPHLYSWRQLLYRTLNYLGQSKESTTNNLLRYSALELKEHLENQNINWKTDHIDHKIPVTWFKPETPPYIVNDLRNLQPLNQILNQQKSNKFCHPICEDYYNVVIEWVFENKIKFLVII